MFTNEEEEHYDDDDDDDDVMFNEGHHISMLLHCSAQLTDKFSMKEKKKVEDKIEYNKGEPFYAILSSLIWQDNNITSYWIRDEERRSHYWR